MRGTCISYFFLWILSGTCFEPSPDSLLSSRGASYHTRTGPLLSDVRRIKVTFRAPQDGGTKAVTGDGRIPGRMSLRQRCYPANGDRVSCLFEIARDSHRAGNYIYIKEDDREECSRWNGGSYLYTRLCHASQLREPMAAPGSPLAARMKHWCSPILTKLQSAKLLKC